MFLRVLATPLEPISDALCDLVPYNLKNVTNTHGGVLRLVKLQSNTPPWVFFTFLKLYKWYQMVQRIIITEYLLVFLFENCRTERFESENFMMC